MTMLDKVCFYVADIVPFLASLGAFIYGVKHFFEKGKAYYLQIVTMAFGCYAMGSLYYLCQSITAEEVPEGFTAAYLGRIGFFLFLFTANFGQMDGLVDDRTPAFKKFRYIALIAPIAVALLYVPCILTDMLISTKISLFIMWIPALCSSYYNFKHAVISDLGYGFVKAIRPYNICALILTFTELVLHILWANSDNCGFVIIALVSLVFSVMSVVTMVVIKRGVEAWKI